MYLKMKINTLDFVAKEWIEARMRGAEEYGQFFELRETVKCEALKPKERRRSIPKSIDRMYSFFLNR